MGTDFTTEVECSEVGAGDWWTAVGLNFMPLSTFFFTFRVCARGDHRYLQLFSTLIFETNSELSSWTGQIGDQQALWACVSVCPQCWGLRTAPKDRVEPRSSCLGGKYPTHSCSFPRSAFPTPHNGGSWGWRIAGLKSCSRSWGPGKGSPSW